MFVKLKVHPGSREEKVSRRGPDSLEIWTRAPAERGLANAAALRLAAAELGVDPKRLMLVKGATSPAKIIRVR